MLKDISTSARPKALGLQELAVWPDPPRLASPHQARGPLTSLLIVCDGLGFALSLVWLLGLLLAAASMAEGTKVSSHAFLEAMRVHGVWYTFTKSASLWSGGETVYWTLMACC